MKRLAATVVIALLAGCASVATDGPAGSIDLGGATPAGSAEELERDTLEEIGNVRVFWYQKPGRVESARERGKFVDQPRQSHVLINRGHSLYAGQTDYSMKAEERFLYNTDMHDLLIILKVQCGFFNKGMAVNIKGDDPVARADREGLCDKMIAVEQIKDGKVNTSYFARYRGEERDESKFERVATFNKCLAFVMQATGQAVPRGSIGVGENKGKSIQPDRDR